jgi:prolipoprotein diacylglyceryltransferase
MLALAHAVWILAAMRQIIFRLPIVDWPIYGFGLMLFVAFVACSWVASRRARREGVPPEVVQDLALWIFVAGIVGARIAYMRQYGLPLSHFFLFWEGGLIFYGSFIGGIVGYLIAQRFLLRPRGISAWKVADLLAPTIALGLFFGRIGCLLNGCCYGNVACGHCPAIHFPMSAPPRYAYTQAGLQTAAGFLLDDRDDVSDPRSLVAEVEPASPAWNAGLRKGDRVVGFDGRPNAILVEPRSNDREATDALFGKLGERGRRIDQSNRGWRVVYDSFDDYRADLPTWNDCLGERRYAVSDLLPNYLTLDWPRGKIDLQLDVARPGNESAVSLPPFAPTSLGLHPTQVYESVSTLLLFLLLSAYYPFRRRDGEVIALFLLCYSVHRYLNEMLRNDTNPVAFGLTLSQNGSIVFFLVGVVLLAWLRLQPAQYQTVSIQAAGQPTSSSADTSSGLD